MKKSIYSVYDSVAEVFTKTVDDINDNTAIRAFTQAFQDQPHKNDYVLFRIATFNDANGELIPEKTPVKVMSGFDISSNVEPGTSELDSNVLSAVNN